MRHDRNRRSTAARCLYSNNVHKQCKKNFDNDDHDHDDGSLSLVNQCHYLTWLYRNYATKSIATCCNLAKLCKSLALRPTCILLHTFTVFATATTTSPLHRNIWDDVRVFSHRFYNLQCCSILLFPIYNSTIVAFTRGYLRISKALQYSI